MFTIIATFTQKELKDYLNAHPFRKKFILRHIKKSKITFEEKYYIRLKSRIHGDFWITEKHLIPTFFDKDHFFVPIYDCPICGGEHSLNEKHAQILRENFPSLIKDFEYVARHAHLKAKKVYTQSLASGKSKEKAEEEFNKAYILYAKELINDTERGKLFFFPDIKSG